MLWLPGHVNLAFRDESVSVVAKAKKKPAKSNSPTLSPPLKANSSSTSLPHVTSTTTGHDISSLMQGDLRHRVRYRFVTLVGRQLLVPASRYLSGAVRIVSFLRHPTKPRRTWCQLFPCKLRSWST